MINRRAIAAGAALLLLLGSAAPAVADSHRPPNAYETHVFVSDQLGVGDIQDTNLVNGWGIVHSPTSPWWVANNGTATSTLYTGLGAKVPLTVKVPGAPTGTVFNGGTGFVVTDGTDSGPARFLFASEDGTISGWNPAVPASTAMPPVTSTQAFVAAHHSKAIYKGLAIATWNGADYLYATDFHRGRIDVFDSTFTRKHWENAFRDRHLPAHYAPFGIQNLNGMIFVTYARQDMAREDEIAGAGKGFVDVFNARGKLLGRVASRGPLNAPWGLAWAPAGFGRFSGDLIVGNFGNGRLLAYRWHDGHWKFDATLRSADHKVITIDGLWGIGFGNNAGAGPSTTLFWAAGPDDETHGAFGSVRAAP
jgi:uncharacterized protein (TIGR03118 family)